MMRRFLWAILLIETAALLYIFRPWQMGDSAVYLGLAESLDHGRYGLTTVLGYQPDPLRPPGYPIILWLFLHVLGMPQFALVLIQAGIYLGILFFLQRFLERRGVPGVILVAIAIVYPFALVFAIWIGTEAWAMLGLSSVALLLVQQRRLWSGYFIIGLICGATALVRSDFLLLPFAVALVIVIRDRREGAGLLATRAVLPILATVMVILPYGLWNHANFGRFSPTPLAGAVGPSLYLASWQRHLPFVDLRDMLQKKFSPEVERAGLGAEVRRLNRQVGAPEATGPWNPALYPTAEQQIAMTQVFGARGIERIKADPGNYATHVVRNVWELWNTTHYPPIVPEVAALGLRITSGLVYVLGLAGMAMAVFRRDWPIPWAMVPIALYPMGIHLWLHTEGRYTASARPLLILFAASLIAWLVTRLAPNLNAGWSWWPRMRGLSKRPLI